MLICLRDFFSSLEWICYKSSCLMWMFWKVTLKAALTDNLAEWLRKRRVNTLIHAEITLTWHLSLLKHGSNRVQADWMLDPVLFYSTGKNKSHRGDWVFCKLPFACLEMCLHDVRNRLSCDFDLIPLQPLTFMHSYCFSYSISSSSFLPLMC